MNENDISRAANVLDQLHGHSSIYSILQLPFTHALIESNQSNNFSLSHLEADLFGNVEFSSYLDFCNRLSSLITLWIRKMPQKLEVPLFRADRLKDYQEDLLKQAKILMGQQPDPKIKGRKIHELQTAYTSFTWPDERYFHSAWVPILSFEANNIFLKDSVSGWRDWFYSRAQIVPFIKSKRKIRHIFTEVNIYFFGDFPPSCLTFQPLIRAVGS